jgi:hypothetical protein
MIPNDLCLVQNLYVLSIETYVFIKRVEQIEIKTKTDLYRQVINNLWLPLIEDRADLGCLPNYH